MKEARNKSTSSDPSKAILNTLNGVNNSSHGGHGGNGGNVGITQTGEFTNDLSESFKKILNYDKQPVEELPYIVGYKGFRRGVKAGNYYGKNFREVSTTSMNNVISKN
jgi:hypothetical protein